jgi:hypothetical protein
VISGDSVSFTKTAATFADKNVGSGKTISVSGISAGGTDGSNYSVNGSASTSADISALGITVTATGSNKIYDGTTAASVSLASSGVISGDSVSFTKTAATFADKNVGSGKTISVSGISASGLDGGNYFVTNSTANTSANITVRTIAVQVSGGDKLFDGNAVTDVLVFSRDIFSGDEVSFAERSALFASQSPGLNQLLRVRGIVTFGADKDNYIINNSDIDTLADIITVRPSTISDSIISGLSSPLSNNSLSFVADLKASLTAPYSFINNNQLSNTFEQPNSSLTPQIVFELRNKQNNQHRLDRIKSGITQPNGAAINIRDGKLK